MPVGGTAAACTRVVFGCPAGAMGMTWTGYHATLQGVRVDLMLSSDAIHNWTRLVPLTPVQIRALAEQVALDELVRQHARLGDRWSARVRHDGVSATLIERADGPGEDAKGADPL